MSAIVLDTLEYANKLKQGGFSESQAEAQARALAEVVDKQLTTKAEMVNLTRDIKELETTLTRDLKELETGLRHGMKELETRLQRDLAEEQGRASEVAGGAAVSSSGLYRGAD